MVPNSGWDQLGIFFGNTTGLTEASESEECLRMGPGYQYFLKKVPPCDPNMQSSQGQVLRRHLSKCERMNENSQPSRFGPVQALRLDVKCLG